MAGRYEGYRLDGHLFEPAPMGAPVVRPRRGVIHPSVDLRQHCSPIEDQGTLGSCAACAVVGAMEYLQRASNEATPDLSVLFVYWNGRYLGGDTANDTGLLMHHAIAALLAYGACREELLPYAPERFAEKPSAGCFADARRFEAMEYARIDRGEGLMQALSDGLPVIFGSFFPKMYYDYAAVSGEMLSNLQPAQPGGGGHSMLIVGYDQAQRWWLVRNSWGEGFGERGYLRIPFDVMNTYTQAHEFWVVGRLSQRFGAPLEGVPMAEALARTQLEAPAQMKAALERLRAGLRKELDADLDAAKKGVRDRLRGPGDGGR
jgi:hypothetical protein